MGAGGSLKGSLPRVAPPTTTLPSMQARKISLTGNRMPLSGNKLLRGIRSSKKKKTGTLPMGTFVTEKLAIILACDDYTGTKLPSLKYCVSDARRFQQQIEGMGFEVVAFNTNKEATVVAFNEAFDVLVNRLQSKPLAQVIFYFAGHGVVCKRDKGWFALFGWDNERENSTGVRFSALKRLSSSIGAVQQLYILDCCHSGRTIFESTRGSNDRSTHIDRSLQDAVHWAQQMIQQPVVYAITAVSGDELSIEVDGAGLFTSCLCEGLNNINVTTASELFMHIQKKVTRLSTSFGTTMTPQGGRMLLRHGDLECTGDFIFPRALQQQQMQKDNKEQDTAEQKEPALPVLSTPTTTMHKRTPTLIQSDPKFHRRSSRRSNVRTARLLYFKPERG